MEILLIVASQSIVSEYSWSHHQHQKSGEIFLGENMRLSRKTAFLTYSAMRKLGSDNKLLTSAWQWWDCVQAKHRMHIQCLCRVWGGLYRWPWSVTGQEGNWFAQEICSGNCWHICISCGTAIGTHQHRVAFFCYFWGFWNLHPKHPSLAVVLTWATFLLHVVPVISQLKCSDY